MPDIRWKIGVEVELLAPRGASRRTLAERLAADADGQVVVGFHAQTEPSLAPGVETFDNLTLAFTALDGDGALVARCVDDLTLIADLDRETPSQPGWFRIVSDDRRMLHLCQHLGRADGALIDAVAPVAAAFGTEAERFDDGMIRVCDPDGAPVVIGASLPGERERPCELVTPPLSADHAARLDDLLRPARELGFTVPLEAAVHVHFDATTLRDPAALRGLVRLWTTWGPTLRELVGTNPACRQLGGWPEGLLPTVEAPGFVGLPWSEAEARLSEVGLSKFCDLNISALALPSPAKNTVEVRVLPGSIDTEEILHGAALFAGLLQQAVTRGAEVPYEPPKRVRRRTSLALLRSLPLDPSTRAWWEAELA